MSAFEVVFILVTIITSLALTHLLTGFVSVLRNAERVRFSVKHALWAWIAFTLLIGNWASYWSMRWVTSWPAWAVLLILTNFIIQYVFCSLVTPETPAAGKIDLVEFHQREHRRYILALIVLLVASLILNFALGGAHFYAGWWRDSVLSIAALILALLAFSAGPRWVQIGSAGALAALGTYYMIITCNVVAA
jgi:hypothetical protein